MFNMVICAYLFIYLKGTMHINEHLSFLAM